MTSPTPPFRPHEGGSYLIPKDGGEPQRVEHTIQPGDADHPNSRRQGEPKARARDAKRRPPAKPKTSQTE